MFLPHIQKCFHHICGDGSVGDIETGASQCSDVTTLADILSYQGESTPAWELYQWILAREEMYLGKNHPNTPLCPWDGRCALRSREVR